MKDTIIVDGVKYVRAEEEKTKQGPFDIEEGDRYYWISYRGTVCDDVRWDEENDCIPVANACKDKKLMGQRALHEILNRLLWRASVEAGETHNEWGNNKNTHYKIIYDYNKQDWDTEFHWTCKDCDIYFPTKESAQAAIDNIIKPFMAEYPDFVW